MDRVPTWAELRIDAIKLIHSQRNCYNTVHELLDVRIPELDRKIQLLVGGCTTYMGNEPANLHSNMPKRALPTHHVIVEPTKSIPRTTPNAEISPSTHSSVSKISRATQHEVNNNDSIPILSPAKGINIPRSQAHSPTPELVTKNELQADQFNLDGLEHLKCPPLPLSEYLRLNKPEIVERANRRVSYIHSQAEKRKLLSTSRIINSFEKIRLSSRNSFNGCNNGYSRVNRVQSSPSPRETPTFSVREYRVKCKLSEQEMKRLTAKTYRRLPEVKKRRNEELTNFMRVQNYKNKLEYSRKLLENRRHGIINYPLRTSCEDTSIISSQDDSLNGVGGTGSADAFCSDPFY